MARPTQVYSTAPAVSEMMRVSATPLFGKPGTLKVDRLQLVVTLARMESVFSLQMIDTDDTGFYC